MDIIEEVISGKSVDEAIKGDEPKKQSSKVPAKEKEQKIETNIMGGGGGAQKGKKDVT